MEKQSLQTPTTRSVHTRASHMCPFNRRQRRLGLQGRRPACPLVRALLFEWFMAMRYSIDWKAYDAQLRSRGKYKCLGRFPRSLLVTKVQQLLHDYTYQCLLNGWKVQAFDICDRWFKCWQAEYGTTMRKPNRKYKVPKHVLDSRVEIWYLSGARVRALCMAAWGYDPECENFDQTPYHSN